MTLVVDASVVVAALIDAGSRGDWAAARLRGEDLVAPHLMPVEVASVLRRKVLLGELEGGLGALAHGELTTWSARLVGYAPFARRVWELRDTLTAYDAWYVAVAEALDVPLMTLDARLAKAPGPRCALLVPPGSGQL